ncbi:MAG TPA: DUF4810 domain-containing protein [Syntrophales bacterium]|jgi:hypothetical protein|nr:DUF4810 domain-containing protein [Syntrophales bacterium]HON22634.1 DUF4810 domain-containing protein [Syntrophales bacterium]HOU76894.1 DUF4810 domain-containing protein [Syntrophales bacterium]HPC31663.1 DUF4810 domain-containing protein [Syntrophales bacterium]HQG34282.1 DUF4810 domain-containing protein [Syntrophales bacterium]
MNVPLVIVSAGLILFLSGCAGGQKMYYWGDYSDTLYKYKKNPSEQSLLDHRQSLERILEESAKNNLRVPPGVYAELGYIYFRQNKKDLAIQNFQREKALYPEATLLMDRLEKAAVLADKPKDDRGRTKEPPPPDKTDRHAEGSPPAAGPGGDKKVAP